MSDTASTLLIPIPGDWVVYRGQEGLNLDDHGRILLEGTSGVVLDYESGGPECPPCIVVAWWHEGWYYVHKHLPEELENYSTGV